jgi:uncharacterized lipoprotein YajG
MKKILVFGVLIPMLAACTGQADTQQETGPNVIVYKSPT